MDLNSIRKLAQNVKRRCLHFRRKPLSENGLAENSILLASSGRSGSTWISELLVQGGQLRFLFEPLHPRWVKGFQNSPPRIYLDPDHADSKMAGLIGDVLRGKTINPWIDQHNQFRNSQRRLIKCIRANLALPWIRQNYPAVKIIYLVRNPVAQSSSASRGGWYETKHDALDFVRSYPELESYACLIDDAASFATTPFTNAIRFWCLENLVVLKELDESDVHFIYYEDALGDPESVVPDLFSAVDLELPKNWLKRVAKPSKTSRPGSSSSSQGNASHFKAISRSDIAAAEKIIDIFSLGHLYEHSAQPVAGKGNRFLKDRVASQTRSES